MLHRCSPINKNNLSGNEHLKVSPEFLRAFLLEQRKTHDFISLDDLPLRGKGREHKRPFIIMTFDDGYLDNYQNALPVFNELKVPWTVYISNCFPNRTAFLWWYMLEDIVLNNETIELSGGERFFCKTKPEKEKIFLELRELILKQNQESLPAGFLKMFSNYPLDPPWYNKNLCLSWEMIKEMAESDYCTIAGHTMNHKILNQLSFRDLEYEIMEGKRELETRLQKPVRHFSYPFGTLNEVGPREIKFAASCGFATVCFAFGGPITSKNINKKTELPRIFFGEMEE
jgi:peptidoglycan/xylan/chitin deacetylase (PgdA/CDA1 family)